MGHSKFRAYQLLASGTAHSNSCLAQGWHRSIEVCVWGLSCLQQHPWTCRRTHHSQPTARTAPRSQDDDASSVINRLQGPPGTQAGPKDCITWGQPSASRHTPLVSASTETRPPPLVTEHSTQQPPAASQLLSVVQQPVQAAGQLPAKLLAFLQRPSLLGTPCSLSQLCQPSTQLTSPSAAWHSARAAYGVAAAAALQQDDTDHGSSVQTSPRPTGRAPSPLPGFDVYKVAVVTGNLRGAGTPSTAYIQLIGTHGSTDRVLVGNDDQGTLDRGSTRTVDVIVPAGSLGSLRRVLVTKQRNPTEGDGWYLKHVEVDMPEGERQVFPCDGWLGESDAGDYFGPLERNLLPAVLPVERPAPVKVLAAGLAIPHPEKVYRAKTKGFNTRGFGYGGEDSYYFAFNSNNGIFSMGVADGVYMWHEQGIDSGLMSRALMNACRSQICKGVVDLIAVLKWAVAHVQTSQLQGSTTLCMLTIDQTTGQLHSANLGDSGFIVLSPVSQLLERHAVGDSPSARVTYEVKFRTDQLEHSFGCPYQLGHHAKADRVEDSDVASFYVSAGDVVVMGTDGLLDNLSDMDLAKEMTVMMQQRVRPHDMVQRITKLAFDASMDRKRVTPYSKGASEAFNMVYSGGKPDDITVLVATCT